MRAWDSSCLATYFHLDWQPANTNGFLTLTTAPAGEGIVDWGDDSGFLPGIYRIRSSIDGEFSPSTLVCVPNTSGCPSHWPVEPIPCPEPSILLPGLILLALLRRIRCLPR